MSALVLVEHNNKDLHPSTHNVLAAALALDEQPVLLVMGYQCRGVAEQAAVLKGVRSVILIDSPSLEHHLAENMSRLIAELSDSFSVILGASSTFGKNILPRVAALIDVIQVSDVTHIMSENTFEHLIYAGNAVETVQVMSEKKVLSIRTTAFNAVSDTQDACCIETLDKDDSSSNSHFVRHELSESSRPDLSSASIVVSGGRGVQNAENFKLIEALADALGAAVGASRAAVDAGFVPNDYQVGQTGKIVAPTLYIAVGISGAVQHMAGMKDSKVIVAINKDEDAPIFQVANYGIVGDLFEVVPELIDKLK